MKTTLLAAAAALYATGALAGQPAPLAGAPSEPTVWGHKPYYGAGTTQAPDIRDTALVRQDGRWVREDRQSGWRVPAGAHRDR